MAKFVGFNEIAVRNGFMSKITEIFANEYDLLGTEVVVGTSIDQEPSFPCCIVRIVNPVANTAYDDSAGSFRKINFSLECDLYSKELENFSLEDSVIALSQILIQGMIEKYHTFVVTRNMSVPYRTDVKRRVVDFACTYDVENKIIYSN